MAQAHQSGDQTQRRSREAGRDEDLERGQQQGRQQQMQNRQQQKGQDRDDQQDQDRGEQQGRQQGQYNGSGRSQPSMVNISAIYARSFGQLYDMQAAAARMFLQTQARAAAAFGIPDYSDLFRLQDDRARRVFSDGTHELMEVSRQAKETLTDVQQHIGRLLETNTVTLSETWRNGLREFSQQAEEGMSQLKDMVRQQAEEAMRSAQAFSEATRESMRETGEDVRETMRQGAERGREAISEQGEAMREQAGQAQGRAQEARHGQQAEQSEAGRRSRAA